MPFQEPGHSRDGDRSYEHADEEGPRLALKLAGGVEDPMRAPAGRACCGGRSARSRLPRCRFA